MKIKVLLKETNAILLLAVTLSLVLLSSAICRSDDGLPKGLSFIGLHNDGFWQIYLIIKEGTPPKPLPTAYEPRNHSISLKKSMIAYVASDGALREFSFVQKNNHIQQFDETILLSSDKDNSYIQPVYSSDGDSLFVVKMKNGSSTDTDILRLKSGRAIQDPVVNQQSSQFEPFYGTDGFLYFSSVHCTKGCGKSIQEIWRKNLISGEAEQLTLINAVARYPVVSQDGKWLYFSSDKAGSYHIWRFSIFDKRCDSFTTGDVSDINPVLDSSGNLYFIRYSKQKIQLMFKLQNEMEKEIVMPAFIKEIRDLRINQ